MCKHALGYGDIRVWLEDLIREKGEGNTGMKWKSA